MEQQQEGGDTTRLLPLQGVLYNPSLYWRSEVVGSETQTWYLEVSGEYMLSCSFQLLIILVTDLKHYWTIFDTRLNKGKPSIITDINPYPL